MKRKITALLLVMVFCACLLPFAGNAADVPRKPVPKNVTYYNTGDEPSIQAEYEDADGKNWVEVYLIGKEVKEGDAKTKLGFVKVDGKTYHLLGIQTIDTTNADQFYKDPKTGRYIIKTKLYLAGDKKPAQGEKVFLVIETGSSESSMTMSDPIGITVPGEGKSTKVKAGEDEKISLTLSKVTVKKSAKSRKVKVTLKINGKKVKGEKVTIRFNGKKYTVKTNSKGVGTATVKASVLKKLKVGKKIKITATYGNVTVQRTTKVKK